MNILERAKHAFYLLSKSYTFIWSHISLLIYLFIVMLVYSLLEIVFLIFLYWRYGIHIFNEATLERWGLISIWDVSLFTLLLIAPLFLVFYISLFFAKLAIAHSVKHLVQNESPHIYESLKGSFKHIPVLAQFARVSGILYFIYDPAFMRVARMQVRKLGGTKFVGTSPLDSWLELTFLVIPVIGFENCSLPHAFDQSDKLMEKGFGDRVKANFSFTFITFIGIILFGVIGERLANKLINPLAGFIIFFLILGFVICVVNIGVGIFQTLTYQYCNSDTIVPFKPEDFTESFSKINRN